MSPKQVAVVEWVAGTAGRVFGVGIALLIIGVVFSLSLFVGSLLIGLFLLCAVVLVCVAPFVLTWWTISAARESLLEAQDRAAARADTENANESPPETMENRP
jgi:glucan phosphoethanolaminetransferase (alkaline phosphatase superfamily)